MLVITKYIYLVFIWRLFLVQFTKELNRIGKIKMFICSEQWMRSAHWKGLPVMLDPSFTRSNGKVYFCKWTPFVRDRSPSARPTSSRATSATSSRTTSWWWRGVRSIQTPDTRDSGKWWFGWSWATEGTVWWERRHEKFHFSIYFNIWIFAEII